MNYENAIRKKISEEYWMNKLRNFSNAVSNGFNNHSENFDTDSIQTKVPAKLTERLDCLFAGKNIAASKFLFFESVLKVIYWRYSNNPDIMVATGNRDRLIFLRTQLTDEMLFREMVIKEQESFIAAIKHSNYDYPKFMRKFEFNKIGEEKDLLQIGFSYEEFQPCSELPVNCRLSVSVNGDDITLNYSTRVLDKITSTSFLNNYISALELLIDDTGIRISDVDILSLQEKEMLDRFSRPEDDFEIHETVLDHLARQVRTIPDQVAIVYGDTKLSYRQLDERSDTVAWFLRNTYNIKVEDVVGIMLERSEWLAVITLGILKTGSAYVAIDQTYPEERKQYVLRDSGCSVLLVERGGTPVVKGYWEGEVISIDQLPMEFGEAFPLLKLDPGSGSFMIYTSGSTGSPKGMMQTHKCLLNVVLRQVFYGGFERGMKVLQYSSVSFDVYIAHELFFALLSGGSLYFIDEEQRRDLVSLGRFIATWGIEWLLLPVSALNTIVEVSEDLNKEGLQLKHLVSAGEQLNLSKRLIVFLQDHPHIRLHNFYGPSETHNATNYTIPNLGNLGMEQPVGRPSTNTRIFILAGNGQKTPVGVPGELYISGAGLAQGYVNLPELTREKFIPNPYLPGELMYKTGDIGRWLSDGNIMYMGRVDDQVKIRGYRIELGEIENRLLKHPKVRQCAIVAIEDRGIKELVSYIVSTGVLSVADLRSFLLERLPEYMVPGCYVQLEELPLNTNGKVDKKKLPKPDGLALQTGMPYIAPRNDTEVRLVRIWQEILGRDKISVKDDFFEWGGHSLKATRLGSQVHKEFDVKIALRELFTHTVLENQAVLIDQAIRTVFMNIQPVVEQSGYLLSPAQRRLWVLSRFTESNVAYNMAGIYLFEGPLDREALSYSFQALIDRHEILRTIFKEDEQGEPRQYIKTIEESAFRIPYTDLRDDKCRQSQETRVGEVVRQEFLCPFDLAEGPLLRIGLYQIGDERWVFTYTMHHIISDGWSMQIVIRELLLFYKAFTEGMPNPLAPLRIQYKDYASWQRQQLSGASLESHKAYWLKQFKEDLPVLDLEGDKRRPAVKTYNGATINKIIDPELTQGLQSLCRQEGSTLFMGLLAVVNTLLFRYTGHEDIVIGSPIAGREHADLEDQIGFYVNMLALRIRFKCDDSYMELLSRVREITLGAYEHQAYPFDELVNILNLKRDMSRSALFDVMVVLQNNGTGNVVEQYKPGEFSIKEYEVGEVEISKFDLTFSFVEVDASLHLSIKYNVDVYSKSMAESLGCHLYQLLKAIIASPHDSIKSLDYLSKEEKRILLTDFNDAGLYYPQDSTVISLLEEQVFRTPDNIALVYEGRTLTYKELNDRANRMAWYLRERYDIKPDDLIGICLGQSEYMIIGIIAVLKSGGAYVPMDPEYPMDRIAYMVSDMGAKLILTDERLEPRLKEIGRNLSVAIENIESDIFQSYLSSEYSQSNPTALATNDNLSYIIYTSGTTGKPKGVMITGKSLMDYFFGIKNKTNIKACKSFGLVQPITFDSAATVIYSSLLTGAELHVFSESDVRNPEKMFQTSLDCLKITPSHWKILQGKDRILFPNKCLILGGEALTKDVIDLIKSSNTQCEVYNHYGPTETAVGKLIKRINFNIPGFEISVGYPIGNTQVYITDEYYNLLPIGAVGEICIGGDGLARGYLNLPELTREKFIVNPFKAGGKIYKTGDLGKRLFDGSIAFIGRKDHQVKIRGYRIEPGEIEYAIQTHENVKSAVVSVVSDHEGEKVLVAYVVSSIALNASDIRSHISRILPGYMLPIHYVELESFPLTSNGKVDRKRLPAPEGIELGSGVVYVAPCNEMQERLANIWQDILGKEKIGVKDDFFELGGHSLKAIQLISRISKDFDVSLSLISFFSNPTIEGVSEEIENVYWAEGGLFDADNAEKISI